MNSERGCFLNGSFLCEVLLQECHYKIISIIVHTIMLLARIPIDFFAFGPKILFFYNALLGTYDKNWMSESLVNIFDRPNCKFCACAHVRTNSKWS